MANQARVAGFLCVARVVDAPVPYYILFEDFTHVKFYSYSLRAVVQREDRSIARFVHIDDRVPPVVRTATKGDDPRRTP